MPLKTKVLSAVLAVILLGAMASYLILDHLVSNGFKRLEQADAGQVLLDGRDLAAALQTPSG